MTSNGVTITENVSGGVDVHTPSGVSWLDPEEVAALRAHFAAERMPEDVQELVQELVTRLRERARRLAARREVEGYKPDREDTIAEIEAAVAALEAAYSQKGVE